MRPRTIPALLGVLLIVASACGGDDTDTASTAVAASTTPPAEAAPVSTPASPRATIDPADAEFCAAVAAINGTEALPTVDDVLAYQAVAPAEVQEPVQVVLDALAAADGDFMAVFADEAAGAALEQITAVEERRCGSGDEGPPQDPMVTVIDEAATRVDVVASEYAFDADLPSDPGRYSFVMSNEGAEPHVMILLRLADGAALDDVLQSTGDEGVAEQYESSPAAPGGEGVLSADLGTGNWVLLCPIPGPTGAPHLADGMLREFSID